LIVSYFPTRSSSFYGGNVTTRNS